MRETRDESVVEITDWNMGVPREVRMGIIGRSERWESGEVKMGIVGGSERWKSVR